ncbi:Chitin deacetylase [Fusarium oxysporum f. sp. cubense]|uniref:Chitin deacetylase n=1 Tax=Fusarium oxysporum f. sp. cubense TaxID=61366 RepID=A0A559LWL0_FUSOC|nr:Chitin deacetylase [Fusarium oxysporum f. sp. cubense]
MKTSLPVTLAYLLLHAGTVLSGPVFAADDLLSLRDSKLRKRAECGLGIGSCNPGSCCSESGFCGTTGDFCGGSACQLEYSDSCDTFNGHEADIEASFGPRGSSTEGISRPQLGNVPYGTVITTCTTPGVIALTFDDGPLDYTNDLLDLLDERNVQATFFVAGNNRAKGHIDDSSNPWPAVMRRMYSAGHHIASHTWTHRNLNEVNSTIRRSEMIYNEMAFRNLFGWIPTYMRAPYLECNAASGCLDEMSELGYHVVDQNIDTKDYENDNPALIQISKDRYSSRVSSNSDNSQYIVLAHDVHDQTVHNLTSFMIDTAQDRGYRLVTVGECLGDPRENWYRTVSRGRDVTSTESATPTRTVPPTNVSVTTRTATATGGLLISPNQQCGGNTGYTCQGSAFGGCCSWYGYCGSSESYCGTGCDSDFGSCTPSGSDIHDTTNGLCGPGVRASCGNYGDKTCCSQYGFCGNSAAHCGAGCQGGFGECN